MIEAVVFALGVILGAWLMHRKQIYQSPIPTPKEILAAFTPTPQDDPEPEAPQRSAKL